MEGTESNERISEVVHRGGVDHAGTYLPDLTLSGLRRPSLQGREFSQHPSRVYGGSLRVCCGYSTAPFLVEQPESESFLELGDPLGER